MTFQLLFPPLSGGQAQGLNDAGVETFTGSIDMHLARECGQNTGDAKAADAATARLEFSRLDMAASDIPGFPRLRETLGSCLDYWKGKDKEEKFFKSAIESAGHQRIPVLRIRDSSTVGLSGSDTDINGRWYALVKSQGLSIKGETAGGSFGIGKSSPFAASRFRTVFYSTRLNDGSVAFQGVCRLVTHRNSDGRQTQGTGFIGAFDATGDRGDPVFRAVRVPSEIPQAFKGPEPGTDIWVVGYASEADWQETLVRSILSNFLPAIHRGSLAFKVGNQAVNHENCQDLVERYSSHPDFLAHHFYKALITKPLKKTLRNVGTCELHLATNAPDFPKQVCMARGNGMRIYDYPPKACRVPFAGVFICTDKNGNKLLRQMEPPRHDKWEPERAEDQVVAKRALTEIKEWIREEVKRLNPFFSAKSFNEAELAKYLPDEADDATPEAEDSVGDAPDESLEPKPGTGAVETKLVSPPVTRVAGDDDDDSTGVGPSGTGGGAGSGGGVEEGGVGTHGNGKKGKSRPLQLSVRGFSPQRDGTYTIVLRSDVDFSGSVAVNAVGEDGSQEPLPLSQASLADDTSAAMQFDANKIRGVVLKAGVPLRLTIRSDSTSPRSISATVTS